MQLLQWYNKAEHTIFPKNVENVECQDIFYKSCPKNFWNFAQVFPMCPKVAPVA